jgi:4-hydroxybenzoate polyprenyltransferase
VRGLVRLTHPFPSILDGLVVLAIALIAGGGVPTALRLGLSMIALQASIGALNDLLDVERDAGRVPPKPIPGGQVSVRAARALWVGAAVLGLALAAPSGLPTLVVALAALSVGYGYDRFAKGTAWSWLPFAVGIPLLPVFGWVGTGAALPPAFLVLLPCAVLAGSALAIANASADLEQDEASGTASVAVSLGLARAWAVETGLIGIAAALVLASMVATNVPLAAMVAALGAATLIGAGLAWGASVAHRRATPSQRQRSWEIQAVGIGLLGTVWLLGLVRTP